MIFKVLLVLCCFTCSLAQANVEVVWGNGKLNIKDLSRDEALAPGLKVLQTEILIKEDLFNKILSNSVKKEVIIFNQKKESLDELKNKISNIILKHKSKVSITVDDGKNKVDIDVSDDSSHVQIFDTKGLVVVSKGDEVVITEGEVVDTLMVVGGSVTVNGEVRSLVLVKGTVNVGADGKITDKITELSGTLNIADGGFVTGNKIGMLDNFNFSGDPTNLLNFDSSSAKLLVAFIRFIQVLFLFWLGFKVIPYLNSNLFLRQENWLFEGFVGLVHFCLMPFITFILTVTVVGLAIVPIYSFLFYIMGMLGYGLISAYLGHKIHKKISGEINKKSKYLYLLIGFIVFESLMFIPVFGLLVLFCLMVVSVGFVTNLVMKQKK